ncbi:MAG: hypothetical protein WBM08_01985 [Prochlorococcaceae cyanobacterium]
MGCGSPPNTIRRELQSVETAEAVQGSWPVLVSFGVDRASHHSPAAFWAIWAHGKIHSTRHESRLKRGLGGAIGTVR